MGNFQQSLLIKHNFLYTKCVPKWVLTAMDSVHGYQEDPQKVLPDMGNKRKATRLNSDYLQWMGLTWI